MGLEFLARVRRATLIVGGVASLMLGTYAPLTVALGFTLGGLWSLANLGLLEQSEKNLPAAQRCFERAVAGNPRYAHGFNMLGQALSMLGRNEDACVLKSYSDAAVPVLFRLIVQFGGVFESP